MPLWYWHSMEKMFATTNTFGFSADAGFYFQLGTPLTLRLGACLNLAGVPTSTPVSSEVLNKVEPTPNMKPAPNFLRALEEGAINNGADDRSIKVFASTGAGAAISDMERTTATVIDHPSRTLLGYGYYDSSSLVESDDTAAGGDPLPTLPRVIVGDWSLAIAATSLKPMKL